LGGLTVQSFRKASALRRLARKAPIVIITAGLLTVTPLSAASAAQVDPPHSSHKASSASTPLLTAFIAEASQRFQVPVAWIRAVMHVESGGRLRAVSPKGAMGLMQIMPKTYAGLRLRYHLGEDPYDPRDNILAGAAYLREMHDRYGSPGFLAAYNAGPERYDEHLATGRPLPIETQAYVAMLMPMIDIRQPDGKIGASALHGDSGRRAGGGVDLPDGDRRSLAVQTIARRGGVFWADVAPLAVGPIDRRSGADQQGGRRGRAVAVARKLATIMHAMWRGGTYYCGDPAPSAGAATATAQGDDCELLAAPA
jgi:hypothetical protein